MNRILVVDDDIDLLETVSFILTRNGFEIIPLSNCLDVLQTVADERPDLILLDINLGICDGRELCLELKNRQQYPNHILLFSANPELVESITLYKADDFIAKPFNIKEFVLTMREHMPVS